MLQVLAKINTNLTYTCGNIGMSFSGMLPYVVSMIVLIIKIVVPILLIIFGMLDLAKAVMAQKEVIVFFVITIVQMIISFVSNDNKVIGSCFKCFINGDANACRVDSSKDINW